MPTIVFRLFSGGPHVANKFRPSYIGLIVNKDVSLKWKDILVLVRRVYVETENIIAKGKGGRGTYSMIRIRFIEVCIGRVYNSSV